MMPLAMAKTGETVIIRKITAGTMSASIWRSWASSWTAR